MPPTSPRIPPLAPKDFTDEQAEIMGGRDSPMTVLNLTCTLVQHPAVFRAWSPFATQVGLNSLLPARDREILVLRAIGLCDEKYEAMHHNFIGKRVGLSETEIENYKKGVAHGAWEKTLVTTSEELIRNHCISDATWAALAQRYDRTQMIELVFTIGMYSVTAMTTNSFGVQPEPDIENTWKPPVVGVL